MPPRLLDPRIKLRHIACFIETARLKSLGAAATALNISQPAASKTIQELESLLNVALFDRSRRTLILSPQGEVFYRYANTSVGALRQGIDTISADTGATIIKIGALPTVSARILPKAVSAFMALGLRSRTRIVTGPNAHLLSMLRIGEADVVIGRMAEPDAIAGFSFEHLYSERIAFVVRPGHPLLSEPNFKLAMIEPYQVLMPPPGSVILPTVERLFAAHGVPELPAQVETVSDAFGRSFTRLSDAIWIISEGVVAMDVADGQLMMLPADTSETLGPVGLTTRTDTMLSEPTQMLLQTIRDVVRATTTSADR